MPIFIRFRATGSGHGKQNHNGRKDHQVGIEQDEHAGMVEAPSALQAAGCLRHAPRGNQQGKNLPSRAAQVSDERKPGQTQAGREGAQRESDGANERRLPQAKDGNEETHNPSMYRGGRGEGCCEVGRSG